MGLGVSRLPALSARAVIRSECAPVCSGLAPRCTGSLEGYLCPPVPFARASWPGRLAMSLLVALDGWYGCHSSNAPGAAWFIDPRLTRICSTAPANRPACPLCSRFPLPWRHPFSPICPRKRMCAARIGVTLTASPLLTASPRTMSRVCSRFPGFTGSSLCPVCSRFGAAGDAVAPAKREQKGHTRDHWRPIREQTGHTRRWPSGVAHCVHPSVASIVAHG